MLQDSIVISKSIKVSGNSENKEKADEKYLKSILEDFFEKQFRTVERIIRKGDLQPFTCELKKYFLDKRNRLR
ncbi:hypothetical protein DXB93_12020 [Thomasclavelia ramosa]|uniref:Uncharacterized protein n=1 Tax=Thomasclavelia ramosa TaxID=1547 RepID=A0A3E3EB90_9FIRM|nr:hypothetical protein DXB93_12020 [Thomasclavelia ramosa]